MSWRNPPSITLAVNEASVRWPSRLKSHDGTIGDKLHQGRKSDHNPDERGVVHAFDLTHDPYHGVDCEALANHLVKKKDRRIKYIIWNRRICSAKTWVWEAYMGENPHTKHMHVSINSTAEAEGDTSPWWELGPNAGGARPLSEATDPNEYPGTEIKEGSHGPEVRMVQQKLKNRGWDITVDGFFGQKTLRVLTKFQWQNHLKPDGVVGPKTWKELI